MNPTGEVKRNSFELMIDLERLEKEGPTIRVVTENFRAVLSSVAMITAIWFLYDGVPLLRVVSIPLLLWASFYAFMSYLQFSIIFMGAIGDKIFPLVKRDPDYLKANAVRIQWIVGVPALAVTIALVVMTYIAVGDAIKKAKASEQKTVQAEPAAKKNP